MTKDQTNEAERELKAIGLGGLRAVLDALCNREMGTELDCDCAHEHWHIGAAGACLDIHVEPEGWTHCILDLGDLGHEIELHGITTLDQARGIAFLWAATITGDLAALRTRPTGDLAVADEIVTKLASTLQSAWDDLASLPPLDFAPNEARHIIRSILLERAALSKLTGGK